MLFIFLPAGMLAGLTITTFPELMPSVVPFVIVTACASLAVAPALTVQPSGIEEMLCVKGCETATGRIL